MRKEGRPSTISHRWNQLSGTSLLTGPEKAPRRDSSQTRSDLNLLANWTGQIARSGPCQTRGLEARLATCREKMGGKK